MLEVANTTLVHKYLERKTGKVITNQDIHNIKRKYLCSNNSDEEKVFSIFQKILEANGSNVAYVVLDDNETTIELIYIFKAMFKGNVLKSFQSLLWWMALTK